MRRTPPRSHHRLPRHILRTQCQLVREHDFRLVADRVIDLSVSGMLVAPADPVLTGERLLLSFELPHSHYWIDAEAIVTRVIHGRRPGEHTRALALTFDGISGLSRYMIRHSLDYLPPAPPRYRMGRRADPELLPLLVGKAA
jgi:hypothetical protein